MGQSFSKKDQSLKNRHSTELAYTIALQMMRHDSNIYHNKQHVKDVAEFAELIMIELQEYITSEMHKHIITAAMMHDVCHPAGRPFSEIKDKVHDLYEQNTEPSHLESMHAEIAVNILIRSNSFLEQGENKQEEHLKMISELIMATDIKSYSNNPQILSDIEIAKTIIRCADLCHLAKNMNKHFEAIAALNQEIGMTISPKHHADFIKTYAIPQFQKLHELCKTDISDEWLKNVNNKLEYWSS